MNYLDILERDGWHCQLCGLAISKVVKYPDPMSASLDHILPLTAGGHHIAANLQAAHMGCNAAKSNRPAGDQLRMIA
ncbi:MAG: HNH endonuclease [Chloroflexi bacterium]|nr:HNH endonuclease [Chloroflexota bacterium]